MNPAPFSVMDVTPLTRVFRLYRAMGIRHLPVTNIENEVVGILTRKELRTDFCHDLCAPHSRHARAWLRRAQRAFFCFCFCFCQTIAGGAVGLPSKTPAPRRPPQAPATNAS